MTTSTITLEQLQKENTELKTQNHYLQEQLEWLRRQLFGKRSEKFVDSQHAEQPFFSGFDAIKAQEPPKKHKVASHERVKPNRNGKDKITLPENLPVERQVIDIPEKEKVCVETGLPLVKIGEEITQKLAHKPGSYYIKEVVRPKYAYPQKSEAGVRTAELPETLLTRCQADESFLADMLVKKFADHLPLYRQSEMLAREGIGISRQLLCQWVIRCGKALKPIYDELMRSILESNTIFVDETPVDMLEGSKGKAHQAYMWVVAGGKNVNPAYRVYNFRVSRGHAHLRDILSGYSGIVHSDKYGAYESLANQKQIIWCPCWSHIRRKFVEAESGDPPFRKWILRKIRHLFMLERVAWARHEEERLRIRKEKEEPIIDELIVEIKKKLTDGRVLPKSKFREALGYFCGLIPYLKNYLKHAWAHLDNNVAERAVRPLAIGRKNWLFVGNEDGGEAAAIILSLVQTCRALGVNPREYLEDVMRRLMAHNAKELYKLLPDYWAESRKNPSPA